MTREYGGSEGLEKDVDGSRPELLAQPDSLDNTVPTGDAWVVNHLHPLKLKRLHADSQQRDGVMRYIDWAASKNFGIMDINVPRNPTVRLGAHFPALQLCQPLTCLRRTWKRTNPVSTKPN